MPPSRPSRVSPLTRRCLIVVLGALCALPGSCASDKGGSPPAGGATGSGGAGGVAGASAGGAAGVSDASAASGGLGGGAEETPDARVVDAAGPPKTCFENEACAFACGDDATCVERCATTLEAGEKTLLEAVLACRLMACPDKDSMRCRCEAECSLDGPCAEALDACTGGLEDPWCEQFCH
jgi:hypothetical protein